jgi:hypothetical protein
MHFPTNLIQSKRTFARCFSVLASGGEDFIYVQLCTVSKKLGRKAKPSLPTLKHILDTKPENIDEGQSITKCGNSSVQELLTTLRSREENKNTSMANILETKFLL